MRRSVQLDPIFQKIVSLHFLSFSEETCKSIPKKCDAFISQNITQYFTVVQDRIEHEKETDDSVTLVRALDKFCRKLQTANVLTPRLDFARYCTRNLRYISPSLPLISKLHFCSTSTEIVIKAVRRQCRLHLNALKNYFNEALSNVKQTLSSSRPSLIATSRLDADSNTEKSYENLFTEFLATLVTNVVEKIKGILQDLMVRRKT